MNGFLFDTGGPVNQYGAAIDRKPAVEPAEADRRDTQRQAILDRLRRGPATNLELNQIAFRYSARLHELRQAGHSIKTERGEGGVCRYSLG